MANVQVTLTITEFCLHTGVSEDELTEIVGLGVIEPRNPAATDWVFDDHALTIFHRAQQLHRELALDWPGIAVTLTLLEEIEHLRKENSQLHQQLARFVSRP
ncbi:chaperone-modulator protein CbpM [Serratia sp. AS12]|jgi:chaperone modulatory protein CbpM|uniref:chaperone modulator CbpM n=1 Tax=Serratia TaxID=613 RepID=UPI00020EA022|nr:MULTISPECIES: chaperone modulator CbpM [Serratia]AEF47167.1 chaperone-modulator protein CbpM [Serratia plymuthica AS9]AEF52119.1 chaperone-modulator protein CbpM [Serratia sp. AS12]AEG29826.1 chaperone-modulator protein CbpM [Serratia sp. AS13]MBJ7892818.1 chaperone modulator CbpM [Serratia sp. PAMC26656]UTN95852.1 chaperone modulator CbpM [Serratia plymuthica]